MIRFLSFEYPPVSGGISRLMYEVSKELFIRGNPIEIWTQKPAIHFNNLFYKEFTNKRPYREIHSLLSLKNSKETGDVLFCSLWYPEGLIGRIAHNKNRIIFAHSAEFIPPTGNIKRRIWELLLKDVIKSAKIVIANSRFTSSLINEAVPGAKSIAIPLAVDQIRFSPMDKDHAKKYFDVYGKIVLLSVSRLFRFKGHETVFKAIASIDKKYRRNFIYVIAGNGQDRDYLEAKAKEMNIFNYVRFIGFVKESDLAMLYNAADLFTLCTLDSKNSREIEGFGLVFLEAQGCGTPVVGTNIGGIPDAIKNGQGGFLIEQGDVPALTKLIKDLIIYPKKFIEFGSIARRRVEQECTWAHYTNVLVAELQKIGVNSIT